MRLAKEGDEPKRGERINGNCIMNFETPDLFLLEESFRWFGPNDPVPLSFIRQAGATAVFTSLHQIPYGELWPREAIRERRELLERAGLRWTAVESVPVHEGIKTGRGDLKTLFANYAQTLRNLAAEGVTTVIYNFMPVLDWIRTETQSVLPDGSLCLHYNPAQFAAFEIYALKRKGAESDFTPEQLEDARAWWNGLNDGQRDAFVQSIIDVFPGVKMGLNLDDIRGFTCPLRPFGRRRFVPQSRSLFGGRGSRRRRRGRSLSGSP